MINIDGLGGGEAWSGAESGKWEKNCVGEKRGYLHLANIVALL